MSNRDIATMLDKRSANDAISRHELPPNRPVMP
jgi:hypothetical protein